MTPTFANLVYEGSHSQTSWNGVALQTCPELDSFMRDEVASRLNDTDGSTDFQTHLRGLQLTDFGKPSLEAILNAKVPEERDWAVGEALAEAYLTKSLGIQWPWNMERDKRNPRASLPGADIVGFIPSGSQFRLALGEVKTSTEKRYPPQVMSGRTGGIVNQIETLASDLGIVHQLLTWLHPRCKGTEFENAFNYSVTGYLNSGNKDAALFGVLIRDTIANELDLMARGKSLGATVSNPASCNLIAIYLPHDISELPTRMSGGRAS